MAYLGWSPAYERTPDGGLRWETPRRRAAEATGDDGSPNLLRRAARRRRLAAAPTARATRSSTRRDVAEARPDEGVEPGRDPVRFAFDVTPARTRAAIGVAGRRPDGSGTLRWLSTRRARAGCAAGRGVAEEARGAERDLRRQGPGRVADPELEQLGVKVKTVTAERAREGVRRDLRRGRPGHAAPPGDAGARGGDQGRGEAPARRRVGVVEEIFCGGHLAACCLHSRAVGVEQPPGQGADGRMGLNRKLPAGHFGGRRRRWSSPGWR
jgi:hypothetical protein